MRILLVTRNLPPLVGGMERLNWHLAEELAKVAEVRVVGPEGSAALAPAGVVVREAPLKPLWKFLPRARALARCEARRWRPDIVLAGSGLTAPLVRSAARACGAKTAVYVHGLDVAVRHPVYRALWLPAIRRMDRIIANSHATADLCRGIGVDSARIAIVHPGVDLPEAGIPLDPPSQAKGEVRDASSGTRDTPFGTKGVAAQQRGDGADTASDHAATFGTAGNDHAATFGTAGNDHATPFGTKGVAAQQRGGGADAAIDARAFRSRHNLGNRPLLLSVGRLSARKGLREFVTQALPRIVAEHADSMLLIIGDAPKDALSATAQTPASIQAAADAAGVGAHIRFLGVITDYSALGDVYRACNVHVFPVREIPGDPEGFGMVAVEAAAHGLPTVAFATGGVPDAVAVGQSGRLVAPGDYTGFARAVAAELASPSEGCVSFARHFVWSEFGLGIVAALGLADAASNHPAGSPL